MDGVNNKGISYEVAIKINSAWERQIQGSISSNAAFGLALKRLSLIGGHVIIVSPKNKCLQGIKGIIVMETAKTLHIVTKENTTKGMYFTPGCW